MRWDADVYAPDPDALAAEFADRGAAFSAPLKDTYDGLRGFEICDPDGKTSLSFANTVEITIDLALRCRCHTSAFLAG
jgi:hypothetical protein